MKLNLENIFKIQWIGDDTNDKSFLKIKSMTHDYQQLKSVEKHMVWKSMVFALCLLKSWLSDQKECTNIFHSGTRLLAGRCQRSTWDF